MTNKRRRRQTATDYLYRLLNRRRRRMDRQVFDPRETVSNAVSAEFMYSIGRWLGAFSGGRELPVSSRLKFKRCAGMPASTSGSSSPSFYTPEQDFTATVVRKQNLYRAALRGDWITTNEILSTDSTLINAELNGESETALHVAVGTGKAIHYVKELVDRMLAAAAAAASSLEQMDCYGQTPLVVAAIIGNIEAAKLLVRSHGELPYLGDQNGLLPIHIASQYGQKDMLMCLLRVTRSDHPSCPYGSKSGAQLLHYTIEAELYDVAIYLVKTYPLMIDESYAHPESVTPPLIMLAKNPSAFPRRSNRRRRLPAAFYGQPIRRTEDKQNQAIQLVKILCEHAGRNHLLDRYKEAFFFAAENGIVEIVEELAETFPDILWARNRDGRNVFHLAVLHRHPEIFNLVYWIPKAKRYMIQAPDRYRNNILHMAGKLPSLNEIGCAALMMQREVIWFEEVGKFVRPFQRGEKNDEGKTPGELFDTEHEQLLKQGEKWMKSTASACATPSALMATLVVAAAFAVLNNNKIIKHANISGFFTAIAVLTLFTSLFSVFTFQSILTSTYTKADFLKTLPGKVRTGLFTLYLSKSFMTVALSLLIFQTFWSSHIEPYYIPFIPVVIAFVSAMSFHASQQVLEKMASTHSPRNRERRPLFTRS